MPSFFKSRLVVGKAAAVNQRSCQTLRFRYLPSMTWKLTRYEGVCLARDSDSLPSATRHL